MSIFSKLSRAKRAAKSHKEAQQAPAEEVDKPVPYKHVVTHAAIDALSGAPSTWREADRAAIKATNEKRKSQISRNSSGMSSTLPRNSSYGSTSNYSYSRPMALRENRRSYGANGGYYTNSSLTVGNPTYQSSPLASNGEPHKKHKLSDLHLILPRAISNSVCERGRRRRQLIWLIIPYALTYLWDSLRQC